MSDSKAADVSTEVLVDPEAVAQASDDAAEEIAVDNADNDSEQNALSLAAEQAAEGDDPESVALESDGISTTDSGPSTLIRICPRVLWHVLWQLQLTRVSLC